jgi:hypothetical protein
MKNLFVLLFIITPIFKSKILFGQEAFSIKDSAATFVHQIGEEFEGGVIFKLWKDAKNIEHGLIVSTVNLSTGIEWSNLFYKEVGKNAKNEKIGTLNMEGIIKQAGHKSSAALICEKSIINGKDDWYLPSYDELSDLLYNVYYVNKTLKKIKAAELFKPNTYHWSSTEYDGKHAYVVAYVQTNGEGVLSIEFSSEEALKHNCYMVRAVRAF